MGNLRLVMAFAGARFVCQKSLMISWDDCVGGGAGGDGDKVITAIVMAVDSDAGNVDGVADYGKRT